VRWDTVEWGTRDNDAALFQVRQFSRDPAYEFWLLEYIGVAFPVKQRRLVTATGRNISTTLAGAHDHGNR